MSGIARRWKPKKSTFQRGARVGIDKQLYEQPNQQQEFLWPRPDATMTPLLDELPVAQERPVCFFFQNHVVNRVERTDRQKILKPHELFVLHW